ncbi:MAG: hypothetical protein WCG16_06785 [Methylococcales bacterium]
MKEVAVLITGVPRQYERCLPTLQFLLSEFNATYYAVMREEFADADTIYRIKKVIPNIKCIVVPSIDSDKAVESFNDLPIALTVVKMWYEIWYGYNAISTENYDLVFRTRFDVFFYEQFLPEIEYVTDCDVYIPEQMSWSGSNDMLCLANPTAFGKYAKTYHYLHRFYNEGLRNPEAFLFRSLALNGLFERKLDVFFILYRDALFYLFDNKSLNILSILNPSLSTYKIGASDDSIENRLERINYIRGVISNELGFPLYVHNSDFNFFPPEIDNRDGNVFRWLGMHGKIKRALAKTTYGLKFKVHFAINNWKIEDLSILIDGNLVKLKIERQDEYGRLLIEGLIDQVQPFRRPWSNIGFSCSKLAVPSEINSESNDHRLLGVAISEITFLSRS